MNSFTEFTGMLLLTIMAVAYSAVPAIGMVSRNPLGRSAAATQTRYSP